jgi:hypothetical protein
MVVIISCGAKKLERAAPARDLYIGPYFRAILGYALTIAPAENIFVLSAKYGLVRLQDRLKPYDLKMGAAGGVDIRTVRRQAKRLGSPARRQGRVVSTNCLVKEPDRGGRPWEK